MIPAGLAGLTYRAFLENDLRGLLGGIPMMNGERMHFIHGGASILVAG